MNIGKIIFYDSLTGEVILTTSEYSGSVVKKTIEQQIETYTELSERNRDTFDVLELEYGQYSPDFAECNSYRVNIVTKTLEFSYPNPNEIGEMEVVYRQPLTEKIAELEAKTTDLESTMDFMLTELLPTLY